MVGKLKLGKSSIELSMKFPPITEDTKFICLYVRCEKGQSPRETIKEWEKWHLPVLIFPLTLTLKLDNKEKPCGELVINSLEEFPEESVPCPCGHPNHWLLKIERE